MTKAELIVMLSQRLAAKTPLTGAQLLQTLTNAPSAQQQQLVDAVNARDYKAVAELMLKLADAKRSALATAAVTAAFADDSVTTAELISFL